MKKAVHTTLNLPPDVTKKALAKARADGRSLSFVVTRFMLAWLEGEIELPELEAKRKDKPIE